MDFELCQLDKIYLSELTDYNHILNQRNKLLKDLVFQPYLEETMEIWDRQLADYGMRLIRKKKNLYRN